MKKALLLISALCMVVFFATNASAQKLDKFGSSIEKTVAGKTLRVPYTDVISYLGYAANGQEDEVKDGKKFYYIYIWVPLAAPELGVRMMSPVPDKYKNKKAIVSAEYADNKASKDYFDTYITIERSNIISTDKITEEGVKNATWVTLEKNDDSSEMPKNPGGSSYNSLLRYESQLSDPTKAITIGLYRVGFTTYKKGEVNGTFLAEVAAPVKLPGVAMAKTIDELVKELAK